MTLLFWLVWLIDLGICVLGLLARNFAQSFTPDNSMSWLLVLLLACTAGGLLLQLVLKKTLWALLVAAAPLLLMLVWRFLEK